MISCFNSTSKMFSQPYMFIIHIEFAIDGDVVLVLKYQTGYRLRIITFYELSLHLLMCMYVHRCELAFV